MDLGDRKELSPSANLTLISVLGQWDPSFVRGCGKLMEQVSANRYVTMVIYQKLLPRTKKRGVFYLSLKISSLNRLASYDEYPPALSKTQQGNYKSTSFINSINHQLRHLNITTKVFRCTENGVNPPACTQCNRHTYLPPSLSLSLSLNVSLSQYLSLSLSPWLCLPLIVTGTRGPLPSPCPLSPS